MQIDLHHIKRWADMIADTDDRDGEAGFFDTLDGETDAGEIADRLIAGIMSDEALAAALKAQEDAMAMRRKRLTDRAKSKRRVAVELLQAAGIKRIERARATISRTTGRVRVDLTDPEAVPTQLCKQIVTSKPDLDAIKAQIEAGEHVPGAELVRGDDSLTMRVV